MKLRSRSLFVSVVLLFVGVGFCGDQTYVSNVKSTKLVDDGLQKEKARQIKKTPKAGQNETRIYIDGFINGKPVKLALDTGAEVPVLFRKTAERFKFSVKEPPGDLKVEKGLVKYGLTEKCRFQMTENGRENLLHFAVIDVPDFLTKDLDGVLGWSAFKHLRLVLVPSMRKAHIYNNVKFKKSDWKSLGIDKKQKVLAIKTSSRDITQDRFLIDTGSPSGLTVHKELWKKLAGDKADQMTTLSASYMPGFGLMVNEEKWIHDIDLGGLELRDVPVKTGLDTGSAFIKEGIDGIVGFWALSCYTWIIDGAEGKVYYKKNNLIRRPEKYEYNRLGAVFVPKDIQKTNSLLAHVIKGGPGYKAGIRDGDTLLKIGELDVTKWRTDPDVLPLSRFWASAAGTKVDLVLKRGGKVMEVSVALEEIFSGK